jgi:hypothetical protein
MSSSQDAITFARTFISTINTFLANAQALNQFNDRMAKDPELAAAAAAAMSAAGRPNLTAQNFTNAGGAITQITFTLNSGAPTQISYLYALL